MKMTSDTTPMDSQECPICVEKYTLQLRKKIECAKCLKHACIVCQKKFIVDSFQDPHCMFCHHEWDMDFVNKTFSHHFMTTSWKESRGNILFSREQAHMAETMVIVQGRIKVEKIREKQKKIYQLISTLNKVIGTMEHQIQKIENKKVPSHDSSMFSVRQCITENCKGLLEKRTGLCILCQKTTCLHCNQYKLQEEHTCRQEDLDTWKMIQVGSKPCPNCATIIFKTGGCSQMWCTNCHVAFHWNTGVIDNRRIHNPHYFEYLRANPHLENRNPEREHEECDLIWDINTYPYPIRSNTSLLKMFRFLSHYVNYILPQYTRKLEENNLELRIAYLRNHITEQSFKEQLIKREKSKIKNRRMVDIFHTFEIVSRNILNAIREKRISIQEFEKEFHKLLGFTNESISELNQIYKSNIKTLELCA